MKNRYEVGQKLSARIDYLGYGTVTIIKATYDVGQSYYQIQTETGTRLHYSDSSLSIYFEPILEVTPEELEEAKTGLLKWLKGG